MTQAVENFTYANLMHPAPVKSFDHFSTRILPLELRTKAYDLRLLNGGANRVDPYSADDHLVTERWQDGQALKNRLVRGDAAGRILVGEAALRNFGGGQDQEADRRIQRDAVLYIAGCAMDGSVDVRIAPYGVDQRGAATDEVMVASLADGRTGVVEWRLKNCKFDVDTRLVDTVTSNFDYMWDQSLRGDERDTYLFEIAAWLKE